MFWLLLLNFFFFDRRLANQPYKIAPNVLACLLHEAACLKFDCIRDACSPHTRNKLKKTTVSHLPTCDTRWCFVHPVPPLIIAYQTLGFLKLNSNQRGILKHNPWFEVFVLISSLDKTNPWFEVFVLMSPLDKTCFEKVYSFISPGLSLLILEWEECIARGRKLPVFDR